jgi:tetratricopeptide (TPR) repeat protein
MARGRIGRGPLAATLIFGGSLAPVLGFFYMAMVRILFVADHFQYHAMIALIAMATAGAMTVVGRLGSRSRWLGPAIGTGLILPLAVMSHQRMYTFKNEMAAMEELVKLFPQSWLGHYNIKGMLQQQGKYDEALAHHYRAMEILEQDARDNPTPANLIKFEHDIALYHVGAGLLKRDMQREDEAEVSLREGIEIQENLVREHPDVSGYQDDLASSYVYLAHALRENGRRDEAAALQEKTLAIRQKLARDNPAILNYQSNAAESYADMGISRREVGRLAEAEDAFRKAIEIREQLVRKHPSVAEYQATLAATFEDLALTQQFGGKLADATASRRQAVAVREMLLRAPERLTVIKRLIPIEVRQKLTENVSLLYDYQSDLASGYSELASIQRLMGQASEAEPSLHKAIEIRERLSEDNPTIPKYLNDMAASRIDYGILLCNMGRMAEAETSFRHAVRIREKLVHDNPAATEYQDGLAWGYADLGVAQFGLGTPADAEASYRKAIEIRRKLVHDKPGVANFQDFLAMNYRDLGTLLCTQARADEAIACYQSAAEIREKLVQDNPNDAAVRSNLAGDLALCGDAFGLLGNWSESADSYTRSLGLANNSWQAMGRLALAQLAAGNETGYRITCANLLRGHADQSAPEAATTIALALVAGDKPLDDMSPAVALAIRAAAADPSDVVAATLVGAAEFSAGRSSEGIVTLTKALLRSDSAASDVVKDTERNLAGRLLAEMLLTRVYREQGANEELQAHREALREWIDKADSPAWHAIDGLPPWALRYVVEMSRRELAKSRLPASGTAP